MLLSIGDRFFWIPVKAYYCIYDIGLWNASLAADRSSFGEALCRSGSKGRTMLSPSFEACVFEVPTRGRLLGNDQASLTRSKPIKGKLGDRIEIGKPPFDIPLRQKIRLVF